MKPEYQSVILSLKFELTVSDKDSSPIRLITSTAASTNQSCRFSGIFGRTLVQAILAEVCSGASPSLHRPPFSQLTLLPLASIYHAVHLVVIVGLMATHLSGFQYQSPFQ